MHIFRFMCSNYYNYSEMYVFRYEYIKCYFKKSVIILKLIFQTIYFQWRSTLVKIFLENINRNVETFFLVYILFFQTARKKCFCREGWTNQKFNWWWEASQFIQILLKPIIAKKLLQDALCFFNKDIELHWLWTF